MYPGNHAMPLELERGERDAGPRPSKAPEVRRPEARRPEAREAAGGLESLSLVSPRRVRDDLTKLGLLPVPGGGKGLGHFSLLDFFRHRAHPDS